MSIRDRHLAVRRAQPPPLRGAQVLARRLPMGRAGPLRPLRRRRPAAARWPRRAAVAPRPAAQSCPFAGLFSRLRGYSLGKVRAFERSAMLPYRIGVFGRESTSRSFLGFLPRCPLFLVSGWGGDRRYKFRAR